MFHVTRPRHQIEISAIITRISQIPAKPQEVESKWSLWDFVLVTLTVFPSFFSETSHFVAFVAFPSKQTDFMSIRQEQKKDKKPNLWVFWKEKSLFLANKMRLPSEFFFTELVQQKNPGQVFFFLCAWWYLDFHYWYTNNKRRQYIWPQSTCHNCCHVQFPNSYDWNWLQNHRLAKHEWVFILERCSLQCVRKYGKG